MDEEEAFFEDWPAATEVVFGRDRSSFWVDCDTSPFGPSSNISTDFL
jgi:hypothetical protein